MKNCYRGLMFGVALALAVLSAGRSQDVRGPGKEVLELARQSEAGQDVRTRAAALRKRFRNVGAVMRLYNARSQGGIGFGPRAVGIEYTLVNLGEKGLSAARLKKEAGELARVAHINLVQAEIIRGFSPEKPFLGRGKKEWERDVAALKAASRRLLKAVKSGDPKAVQAAAVQINNACDSCHDAKR
jgi:hypothetical protein